MRRLWQFWGATALVALIGSLLPAGALGIEPTVGDLKARLSSAGVGERPHLCLEIVRLQMEEADKLYAADDVNHAETALTDVVTYSELARDYSIQARKHQKQTEIAVRGVTRRLGDLIHSLPGSYQPPLRDAIKRLQHVRDDLLASMFPGVGK
jgi:hypothetical protein